MREQKDAYPDDDEIADGRSVRVPLYLVDTYRYDQNHQPHFMRGYRMTDETSKSDTLPDLHTARDAARAARELWIRQMNDAWKRPPTHHVGEPNASEQVLARHLSGQPDDNGAPDPGDVRAVERRRLTERGAEAQRERDLAWTRYRDNLANAWKTNPRAAVQIERQGERWRGGR